MFNLSYTRIRKSTLFEKLLLIIGIAIGIIGFWMINTAFSSDPVFSWQFLMTTFLWLLLVFMVILTASNESIREDLAIIIKEHIEETRLIKEEIKLLNSILTKNRKK